jgi:uncharacterized protein with HEPN domain
MTPPHRAIADLLRFTDEAADLAARGNSAFEGDRMLQLAAIAIITRIGEASNRVPDDERAKYPGVPWRSIVGMRNRLVHDYDVIDFALVWEVIEHHLPALRTSLGR